MAKHLEPVEEWVEDDDFDDDRDDFDDDKAFDLEQEERASCTCGAYKYFPKLGYYEQVADCICGC